MVHEASVPAGDRDDTIYIRRIINVGNLCFRIEAREDAKFVTMVVRGHGNGDSELVWLLKHSDIKRIVPSPFGRQMLPDFFKEVCDALAECAAILGKEGRE